MGSQGLQDSRWHPIHPSICGDAAGLPGNAAREDEGRRITQYLFKGSAVNFKRVHGVWVDMTGPATGPETNAHFHTLWAMYEDVLAPSDCPALRA